MKQLYLLFLFISYIIISNAIQVSGNQSGIWTTDNNPYEIIGDVTVPSGQTLTVMPGVVVQALGNWQIIAQGNILAIGNVADSIKFISGQTDPNALWKGIRLESTSIQSVFSYCRIDNGQYGINSINSPAEITFCHFKKNQKGIQAYGIGSANPANVLIDNNMIELSIQNGILVAQNSNATITYNEITRNGTSASYYGAIQLSNQSAGGSNNPEIAYNHIHHNYKQGIIAWDIVSANAINPEVHHNLIENNLTGIYFRHSSGYLHHNTVINNFIPNDMNSGAGIMVSGNTAQPYFEDNIITGNFTGFYLTENANPVLGDLSIYHAWAQGGNTIANNIDALNVMHSIVCYSYTAGNFTVKAENNFWDYNTTTGIDSTITDFYDDASFPIIDYTPWQYNVIPIYLAGTVTMANPPVPTATLELVSSDTGLVLNTWTVNINEPFSVPVYHDSLVYIVAYATDLIGNQYYGSYGGTDNPTSTQIVADVQFDIGNLPISTPQPNWNFFNIGEPEMINGHFSYPLKMSWFVYAPFKILYLFRDGNYQRICRIILQSNSSNYDHILDNPPIWMKIDSLQTGDSWLQFLAYNDFNHTLVTAQTTTTSDIITFKHSVESTYDLVKIGTSSWDLFDSMDVTQRKYWHDIDMPEFMSTVLTYNPIVVEPDGTLFPLIQNNRWKIVASNNSILPDYFGYKVVDSLSFYWIPTSFTSQTAEYRIYDNGVLLSVIPINESSATVPIPSDGLEHVYTLSSYWNFSDHFSTSNLVLTFTSNQDEVQPVSKLSVYPNPFDPAVSALKVKYDFPKSANTKVAVYNLKGQLVWNASVDKGATETSWNGRDNQGRTCASGLYQLSLTDDKGKRITRKLMLIH